MPVTQYHSLDAFLCRRLINVRLGKRETGNDLHRIVPVFLHNVIT